MKSIAWITITLVLATALAGCTSQPPANPTGSPASVTITQSPTTAAENSRAVVCWRVEGTGTIPHTAIHTDTTSHPGNAGFADYNGTTYYPNNATAASNVNLPGEFCTSVAVGARTLYIRAHAMVSAPGVISSERSITVGPGTAVIAAVTMGSHNQTAAANSTVTVCWRVTGTGNVPHTALHTDTTRHTTATSFSDYRGSTYYPNNRTSPDGAGYALPGDFCTGVAMPANGTLYFRGHAMTNPPGVMSTESSIAINGSQAMTGLATAVFWDGAIPANAARGSDVTVCFRVTGTGRIPHVAVHTDSESHATEPTATFAAYDGPAYYPNNTTALDPAGYPTEGVVQCTAVRIPAAALPGGQVFLRAHAMDALGAPGRLTADERVIAAT